MSSTLSGRSRSSSPSATPRSPSTRSSEPCPRSTSPSSASASSSAPASSCSPARSPRTTAGPAVALSLRRRRHRLRAGRALLRRVRLHRPGGRLRLHLLLRHARRAARLDHRLGPDAGVRARRGGGRGRLVGLLQPRCWTTSGSHLPDARSPGDDAGRFNMPAAAHRAGPDRRPGRSASSSPSRVNLGHRRHQGRGRAAGHRRRRCSSSRPPTTTRSSRRRSHAEARQRAEGAAHPGAVRLHARRLRRAAASSPPPRSSSSPSSASTSSPPPPRRPRTRSATCRAASSARWSSARRSTSRSRSSSSACRTTPSCQRRRPLADAFKAVGQPWFAGAHQRRRRSPG